MLANDSGNDLDKALEISIHAYKASSMCRLLYHVLGYPDLSEQWNQEEEKVIRYICRKFPLDAVIRACKLEA